MPNHLWISACALMALVVVQSTSSFAQDPKIGNATATKNKVEGVVGTKTHAITKGTDVFSNEVVRTGDASVADLQFIDETVMSMGPLSEIRLDKFVYEPNGTSVAVVFEATRGAFRFVTGKQDQKMIKTPHGTLGIRG